MDVSFLADYGVNATLTTAFDHFSKSSTYDDYFLLTLLALGVPAYLSRGLLWNKPDPHYYKWFERPQEAEGNGVAGRGETRNIAEKLEETEHDLVIFWGSQSGTAEGFAHRLSRDCHRRFKLKALVADLSDYDNDSIALIPASKFAIFIISTYGEGDPSDNAADFHRWLKSSSSVDKLNQLKYAAFGLGNTNYKYYNAVVDLLVESLDKFGATSFLPVGKANEATGTTEEDFLEWKSSLFATFKNKLGLQEHEPEYEPSISIVEDDSLSDNPAGLYLGEPQMRSVAKKATAACTAIAAIPIKEIRGLTNDTIDSGRHCVHLDLDLTATPTVKYKTGDHAAVWPVNPNDEVTRLLRVLDLETRKDIPVLLSSLDPANKLNLPSPTTLQALFQNYLEICAPVSRETVASLAQFAPSPVIKSNLIALSSSKEQYTQLIESNHITLARLLEYTIQSNPSKWQLPTSFILESLQPMTPRYYSISSSSVISPRHASITVAVNPASLPSSPSTTIPGLASTYISSFQPTLSTTSQKQIYTPLTSTPSLYAHIRRSTFKLPASPSMPLIMVANGTGIAPFRAFLQERARFASIGRPTGPILLFFGCRHPDQDYLYRSEIEELQSGPLKDCLEVITAFSRVQGQDKVYVQDLVAKKKDQVTKLLLEEDAAFYICGAAAMAREVGEQVGKAVAEVNASWDEERLKQWKEEKKRTRRWQEDVWG